MQQIYRRRLCRIEIALRHGFSPVNLLHIFSKLFPKNTSGRLLLKNIKFYLISIQLLSAFAKISILDVWLNSEYASVFYDRQVFLSILADDQRRGVFRTPSIIYDGTFLR